MMRELPLRTLGLNESAKKQFGDLALGTDLLDHSR